MKKVSVITINLDNAVGLEKTISSVAAQKGCTAELIVIDGGSADTSVEVIKQHAQHITYWVSEKDAGIYNAMNKGILKATSEYCLFLNSGDVLASDGVLAHVMSKCEGLDIVYGDLITIDDKNTTASLKSPETPDVGFFMVSTLWHPTAFIRRELFDKFGLYDETFKVTGDYEFFIRTILKHNASTKHVNIPVSMFDLGGVSNSVDMQDLQEKERRKSWELNFSEAVIKNFEEHSRLVRSGEYKLGRFIKRMIRPFSK